MVDTNYQDMVYTSSIEEVSYALEKYQDQYLGKVSPSVSKDNDLLKIIY
jgi:hypothetical protein